MRYRRAALVASVVVGLSAAGLSATPSGAAADSAAEVAAGHDEREPADVRGRNDDAAGAERLDGLDPGGVLPSRAQVNGTLASEPVAAVPVAPGVEDDGAIPLATPVGLPGSVRVARVGDGPHGRAAGGTGDFDLYRVEATTAQEIVADLTTPEPAFDSVLALYDGAGAVLAMNDDRGPEDKSSRLDYRPVADGTHFLLVAGFAETGTLPGDPFDPAGGAGAGSEGSYALTTLVREPDIDVFAVDLEAGDTLGAVVSGGARRVSIHDPAGREVMGSSLDRSMQYPPASPLTGGGNAVADHVAAREGRYTVSISAGEGSYTLGLVTYAVRRPTRPQTIFLDFDGATVDTTIFNGSGLMTDFGPQTFRPLADYLPGFGLTRADRQELIAVIAGTVQAELSRVLTAQGRPAGSAVRILTSDQAQDPFGRADVSRVVVGGSSTETGLETVGIAESVDPGNFDREETAVVMLDILNGERKGRLSLNEFLTQDSDRVRFIGTAVGLIVVHEIAHYLGSYHTDGANADTQVMDSAADPARIFGVGPDGVGGTRDDHVATRFGRDSFAPGEGFTGTQDSVARTAFALPRAILRR